MKASESESALFALMLVFSDCIDSDVMRRGEIMRHHC